MLTHSPLTKFSRESQPEAACGLFSYRALHCTPHGTLPRRHDALQQGYFRMDATFVKESSYRLMGDLKITDDWTPTVERVNALPERLRKYIHDLQSSSDFRTLIRENAELRRRNAIFRGEISRIRKQIAELRKTCDNVSSARRKTGT